ncbi:hypothetical protein MHD_01385 [Mannheimia granulomatis]|uniref:Phosphate regulon sensor protein PhoR n=1 Tax=Mannheimia granulomatis TaxID=85402 RepID=A0A011LXY9_9PAST|nr:phosphate regulon sensor histidine kinase PhoR [Mannheimia granulomatis]EXI62058.1 ATPase [Mannheimia granulomatis]RGE48622.1 hypothetical protein MHD_01385 [Mannheimia granulomatis]
MKKLLNFLLELIVAVVTAFVFSLFGLAFSTWLIVILLGLLIWHHVTEYKLLQMLNPKTDKVTELMNLESFSQTISYYRNKNKKEKLENLRLLSKLNKNIQVLPDAIIICQADGEISWCNQVAQRMFDFYWHKKIQKNIFNIIFYKQFKHYFAQRKKNRPLVLFTYDKRYIEIHIHQYDPQTLLIIGRDITEMIKLLRSRQTFLSNINHELRTPLTILQGYLEILEDSPKQTVLQQKAIKAMQEQSFRMTHLLEQLNLLAKIETSSNKEHKLFNMSAMILSLQTEAEILNTYNHQISFNVIPNIEIWGNQDQLHSVVSNLIYNAIKHSGKECRIEIHWQPCEQGMEFSVKDNGIGIPDIHLPHLTERFYRVDESRSKKTGGSGLGLAIVKHALEQHNANLIITSQEGEGSCFSFILNQSLISND